MFGRPRQSVLPSEYEKMNSTIGDEFTIRNVFPRKYRSERLSAQQGYFVRAEPDFPLDELIDFWPEDTYGNEMRQILQRYTLPVSEALECLIILRKMNISHETLFPDMPGRMETVNLIAQSYDYAGIGGPQRGSIYKSFDSYVGE